MDDRISSDEFRFAIKSGEESSTNVENTAEGSRVPTRTTSFFFGVGAGGEAASMGFSTLSAFFLINKYLDYLQVGRYRVGVSHLC